MLGLRWSELSTLQSVLRVVLKWRVSFHSPYAQVDVWGGTYAWELLFCLTYKNEPENWTQASASTCCVEGGLVPNIGRFFLSSLSCSEKRKWGYVRTPSCRFSNFEEIAVWNRNQFGPVFKRKHSKVPATCSVFYIFFELASGNGGSTEAVTAEASGCRWPVFGIRLLHLCSFVLPLLLF